MFPFWEAIVEPALAVVAPRCVVEIGALRGDTTELLLARLRADAELHVIDPDPRFDPSAHERRFAGRYVFHRAASLDVLDSLPPTDLALIDGDHNWYTVLHELEALRARADAAARPAPLCLLHDVSWPYGRRDGYYAPERVPAAFRQPCARLGLARGNPGLVPEGGLNAHVWNAREEGGPRNGVLTAIEDFVHAHPGRFDVVVVDAFVGLGIVVDRARRQAHDALGTWLIHLSSEAGRREVVDRAADAARRAFRPR